MATTTTTTTMPSADLLHEARDTLNQLQSLQTNHPLSILRLSEPITSSRPSPFNDGEARTSSASSSALSDSQHHTSTIDPTPTTLNADLSHYRDLFTKLHFSYIEQVTKEKYLRAIVGDPPLLHTHQENVELETDVLEMKRRLKEKKVEGDEMVEALRAEAEVLVQRWEGVRDSVERVGVLEDGVGEGQERVEGLRREVDEMESEGMELDEGFEQQGSSMKMGLQDTLALIEKRQQEMREMEQRIQGSQREIPGKIRECEIVERDLEALEKRKNAAAAEAREARRRKEQGEKGGRDEVEERGRWYRSQEQVFRGLGLVEG